MNILPDFGVEFRKVNFLAWLPLQSLAVKKILFWVQILGSEKLLQFVEKCRCNIFKRA